MLSGPLWVIARAMTPKKLATRLQELLAALIQADAHQQGSFGDVHERFMRIAEDPDLMNASKRVKRPKVKAVLQRIASYLTGNEGVVMQRLFLLGVEDAGFVHGAFSAPPYEAVFLYFEREDRGLASFREPMSADHRIQFMRITTQLLPPNAVPMKRPPGSN